LGENGSESMVIFCLSENTLPGENTSSLGRKLSRLGKNTLKSTFAPGAFSPRQLYPRLGETTLSPG